MEQEILLRMRTGTSTTKGAENKSMLRHENASLVTHLLPSRRRMWLAYLLLVGSVLYWVLILIWSARSLNAVSSDTVLAQSRKEPSKRDRRVSVVAAPEGAVVELANEQTQETLQKQASYKDNRISTQAELNESIELSHVRGTVRVTQNAAAAEIETKGLTSFDRALTRDPLMTRKARSQKAEDDVQDLHLPSIDETTPRNLTCLGWIATDECSPFGPRKPDKDLGCSSKIPFGSSGYCQVIDTETGERFRVMRSYCSSAAWDVKVSCSAAAHFTNFHREARKAIKTVRLPGSRIPNVPENLNGRQGQRDGIVMVVYPRLVPSAYATIRTLREVQQCQLPIEIWYLDTEFEKASDAMKPLQALAANDNTPVITFRKILDQRASGFSAKVFAIYHSHFERILFLDADNVPSKNPNFLFSSPEFVETGAVFWPDFWHPGHTIFNINNQSLLWEFLDMPFVDMFEQESGQILIDRRRHAEALELVKFYTFHRPSCFVQMKLVYGDKDLFRLAWLKLAAPFHMINTPPAIAGKIMNGSFCGLTMVQHDAQGDVLFLHRNSHKLMGEPLREQLSYKSRAIAWSKKKIEVRQKFRQEGKPIPSWSELKPIVQADELPAPTLEAPEPDGLPDSVVWTHLLSFNSSFKREKYYVKTYFAYPDFPRSQNCYGQRNVSMAEHFYAQNMANLPFAGLEMNLRRFAAEAMKIKQT